jgi:hypothetical protein
MRPRRSSMRSVTGSVGFLYAGMVIETTPYNFGGSTKTVK